jgi:flagellar basal body-associated protein FliL
MEYNNNSKPLSKNIKTIISIIIIVIVLVIIGVLTYFLIKSKNTSESKLSVSDNNLNASVTTQNEQFNKNRKPWQTKSVCEKYKKDYIDTCTEKYNKNLLPEIRFRGCLEFAESYYDCQNYN